MKYVLPIAIIGLMSQPATAASFDCSKASHVTETLICADKTLSQLDEQLAAAYKKRLALALDKEAVRGIQRDFLKVLRSHCTQADCIRDDYNAQLTMWNNPLTERFTSNYKTGDAVDLEISDHSAKGFGFTLRGYLIDTEETTCNIPETNQKPLRATYESPRIAVWKSATSGCSIRIQTDAKPSMGGTWVSVESRGCDAMCLAPDGRYEPTHLGVAANQ